MKTATTFSAPFMILALCASFLCAEGAEQQSLRVYCYDSPAKATWSDASPATFESAIRGRNLHHEIDEHGQGIIWGWAHWLTVGKPPVATDVAPEDGVFKFDATAHLVVFREFWTYEQDSSGKPQRKDWVRRTVCHLTAESASENDSLIQVAAVRSASGKWEVVGFDAAAHSNLQGAEVIRWEGKTIGWASVAWAAQEKLLRTDFRWFDPSKNSALAGNTQNALRLKRPQSVNPRGGLYLNWAFILSEAPIEKERGFEPPTARRRIVLPPSDSMTK